MMNVLLKLLVPVPIMSMNMTMNISSTNEMSVMTTTARPTPVVTPSGIVNLGHEEGCYIEGQFYPDGAQVKAHKEII